MIKDVQIGQKISVKEPVRGEDGGKGRINTYTVIKIYPYHVLAERHVQNSDAVIQRSFNYGDLIGMGLEKQSQRLEALRKEV